VDGGTAAGVDQAAPPVAGTDLNSKSTRSSSSRTGQQAATPQTAPEQQQRRGRSRKAKGVAQDEVAANGGAMAGSSTAAKPGPADIAEAAADSATAAAADIDPLASVRESMTHVGTAGKRTSAQKATPVASPANRGTPKQQKQQLQQAARHAANLTG
jgi:hypothetical protein